jgi:transposase
MRELKGLEIAARCKLTFANGEWLVPSQSGKGTYRVRLNPEASCTCDDFGLTGKACKHIHAARLVRERSGGDSAPPLDTEVIPRKPSYKQDWPAYGRAQRTEKWRVQALLADLCNRLPPRVRSASKPGPKPHLVSDAVFSMCLKVYSCFSARRFACDLLEAHEKGHTSRPIPGPKVASFFEDEYYTPILKELVGYSARPLRAVETKFAIDSSGFATSRYVRWVDEKYGTVKSRCQWVKVHIACGTATHCVCAVRILDKDAGDCPQFVPLVKETRKHFEIGEVSADKAYLSLENFEEVAGCGGTAYIAFKKDSTGGVGGLFERMFHFFQFNREEYLTNYHRRSNVESCFSAVKRKFGDSVRSRTDAGMVNEVLCKFILQNLTCLIQEQETLGIVPVFWKDEEKPSGAADVLPMVKPV